MKVTFQEVFEACRFSDAEARSLDPTHFDESGRDTLCAICRDELCICGNCYDCEHDIDQRHGWSPL